MAFDAGMLACMVHEIRTAALGGRIERVMQPERDEIILQIRSFAGGRRLLINAGANPRIGFTGLSRENPQQAPMFCMLLRKYLTGARLADVVQNGFERAATLTFDTRDEMGFACRRYLIAEVMGKYSNLIFAEDAVPDAPDGRLRIVVEGRERMLEKIESFAVSAPYEMLKASPLEIGSCIQQWSLGTRCRCENGSISFEAGTNRHSYTFNIEPGFVYCRAARLRFNERGGLFAQNIRMMANAREHTAYMAPDNRAESAEPLKIDDSKFSPDQCVFDEDGIYWSFIRFEGDTAVIHGCGELYRFARPAIDDPDQTEWIAFEKY